MLKDESIINDWNIISTFPSVSPSNHQSSRSHWGRTRVSGCRCAVSSVSPFLSLSLSLPPSLSLWVCGRCRRMHSACVDAEGWRPLESEVHSHCLDGEGQAHVLWWKRMQKPQCKQGRICLILWHRQNVPPVAYIHTKIYIVAIGQKPHVQNLL